MRIVVVDTTLAGELIGGAQLFLPGLVGGVVERGHDVHVVAGGDPNEKVAFQTSDAGVSVHTNLWTQGSPVDDSAPVFGGWLNQLAPDIFLISVSPDIGWAVLPMLDPAIATITIGHNDEETFYAPVRHYGRFLTRAIGVSDEICRKYVFECGMAEEAVSWIPYGVQVMDEPPSEFDAGPIRLIYVGRLDEVQKRISDVVSIAKRLTAFGIDFELEIVGDGERREFAEKELAFEIAAGKVRMHGWLSSAEVIAAVSTIDETRLVDWKKHFEFNDDDQERAVTRTLTSILDEHWKHGSSIDVLSIDVGGHDFPVQKSLDLSRYRPKIIVIEIHSIANLENAEIYQYLAANGFEFKFYAVLNAYFTDSRNVRGNIVQ